LPQELMVSPISINQRSVGGFMTKKGSLRWLGVALLIAGISTGTVAQIGNGQLAPQGLIIKYKNGTAGSTSGERVAISRTHEAAERSGVGLRRERTLATGGHVLRPSTRLTDSQLNLLAQQLKAADPDIDYVEIDAIQRRALTPNDSRYNEQWHYYEAVGGANLPSAWNLSTGTGITVAVLDTGFRPHADLVANVIAGYDFISDVSMSMDGNGRDPSPHDPGDWSDGMMCDAEPSSWHGTHVAGTVAAVTKNANGVAGVAFGSKLLIVRVLGRCGGALSDIADGIIWAAGGTVPGVGTNPIPAKVLNLSLGGAGACGPTYQAAIDLARSKGAVVVVAAGNSNADASQFRPANCQGVITVGATNRDGARAYYSNFGSVVDLSAPGGETFPIESNGVLSTSNASTTTPGPDSYAFYQGTSMAAPHVAGVAALMFSRTPSLTPDQIEARLKNSARPFPQPCHGCGTGIVNALNALNASDGGGGGAINELETNNSRTSAQKINTLPVTVMGTVSSASDTDFYAVSVPGFATVSALLLPNPLLDAGLEIQDASGKVVASSKRPGKGAAESAAYKNAKTFAVTYYVRVVYSSGGVGSPNGAYELKLSH
jgi:serine protease